MPIFERLSVTKKTQYLRIMRVFLYWTICFIELVIPTSVFGQSVPFQQLENQVYAYNNTLQYQKTQALLLPILDNPAYTPDEQYQAAVLLSYTYKRLGDYPSTLQFLATARRFAANTSRPDSNRAQIATQQALAYFDTHNYARSDSLMRVLERIGFRYIDPEDRAKLVHQQGYLLFRAKRYPEAEATYNRALIDLRTASPCDMPMILVKKMQLYAAMNQMDQAKEAFGESNRYADSCGILKYRIYAHDELLTIYKARHDVAGIAATAQTLDSLNTAFAKAEHIADLHRQQEAMMQQAHDQQLRQEQRRGGWLTVGLSAVGVVAALLLVGLLLYRRRQAHLEGQLTQMRAELTQYVALSREAPTRPPSPERPPLPALSGRQQEVLTYLVQGLSNREIADRMFVSENTVKYHIKNLYDELNIRSRRELLARMKP